ncbi:hypothetical protein BDFB_014789 [Asbolus verrucosus]|uniref:Uncharacterized protein n=1 Tax=Asbolus verrucosus TaxID=1661398 RepID=A0A482VTC3_ASBVE|nr:hypothetical protein BDFB_014789 [Asbolus verrucosus]
MYHLKLRDAYGSSMMVLHHILHEIIRPGCPEIMPEILTRVRHSFVTRAQPCLQYDRWHFEHLIH